jgi:hypothetical protein
MLMIVGEPPHDAVERAAAIIDAICPVLAGEHPAVVGAVLCELLCTLLVGHRVTDADRERLLQMHIDQVRKALPDVEAACSERLKKAAS